MSLGLRTLSTHLNGNKNESHPRQADTLVAMVTADTHDVVQTRLRHNDQRYTTRRRQLIELLIADGGPMTIPQILDASPSLAQSSVYRNLSVLEEAGVVVRIVTSDDFAHYELTEELTEHHHHLICSECGDVADFALRESVEAELDRALHRAARTAGFDIRHHRLDLVGVCADCRP